MNTHTSTDVTTVQQRRQWLPVFLQRQRLFLIVRAAALAVATTKAILVQATANANTNTNLSLRRRARQTTPTKNILDDPTERIAGPFFGPPILVPPKTSQPSLPTTTPHRMSRIVGGQAVLPHFNSSSSHSFFTMLLLRESGEWRWSGCGGTLVSNCHVLTAAHCVAHPDLVVKGVYVNAHSPFSNNNSNLPYHFSTIKDIDIHSQYDEPTNKADIALITMEDCIANNDDFPPARLPPPTTNNNNNNKEQYDNNPTTKEKEDTAQHTNYDDSDVQYVVVMGFGSISGVLNEPSDILRQTSLPFLSHDLCRVYYQDELLDDMVCAGYPQGFGPDACQGDSGGGLFQYDNNHTNTTTEAPRPFLVGIVSWGVGCGLPNYPGVYIHVPYYYEWIMDRICPDIDVPAGLARNATRDYLQQQDSKRSWCLLEEDKTPALAAPTSVSLSEVLTQSGAGQPREKVLPQKRGGAAGFKHGHH